MDFECEKQNIKKHGIFCLRGTKATQVFVIIFLGGLLHVLSLLWTSGLLSVTQRYSNKPICCLSSSESLRYCNMFIKLRLWHNFIYLMNVLWNMQPTQFKLNVSHKLKTKSFYLFSLGRMTRNAFGGIYL